MSFWAVIQQLWIDILFIITKKCDVWPFEAVMNDSYNIMNDIVNDINEKRPFWLHEQSFYRNALLKIILCYIIKHTISWFYEEIYFTR